MPEIRTLLIDDDEDDYIFIRDLFNDIRTEKISVDWEPNIENAKSMMKSGSHDIYLMDYRLGEKNGLELFKEVKELGCKKPVIFLTGYADDEVDEAAMHAGAADYLIKLQITSHILERSIRYAIYREQMKNQILMQDRLASIGLLSSGVAHDIGSPLGAIRIHAQMLQKLLVDNSKAQNGLSVIVKQTDRISILLRSLLNLARGDRSESIENVSLYNSVSKVVQLMNHEFNRIGIAVENKIPNFEKILVKGEDEKLHQIILNLVVNATQAIEEAIKIGRTDCHSIRFSLEEDKKSWILVVADSGVGISSENLSNMFKPFFTTKDPGVGTGLGLTTSTWIVQSWGGSIEVESTKNIETKFRIRLLKP